MTIEEFSFEYEHKVTEEEYRSLFSNLSQKPLNKLLRRAVFVLLAILCFFWSYTFVLGILGILIIILVSIMPQFIPGTVKKRYVDSKILGKSLTYGVDNNSIWIKGNEINAKVSWLLLSVYRMRNDWLVLQPEGIPPVFLSISQLESRGLYSKVMGLAEKYGKKFKD